jgi:hypothetical protein
LVGPTAARETFHPPPWASVVPAIFCPRSASPTGPELPCVAIVGVVCRVLIRPKRATFLFSLIAWYIAARAIDSRVGASNNAYPESLSPTIAIVAVLNLSDLLERFISRLWYMRRYVDVVFPAVTLSVASNAAPFLGYRNGS